jgi:hypothetical protein
MTGIGGYANRAKTRLAATATATWDRAVGSSSPWPILASSCCYGRCGRLIRTTLNRDAAKTQRRNQMFHALRLRKGLTIVTLLAALFASIGIATAASRPPTR